MVQVQLVGVPLLLRARHAEYGQDLMRELTLVRMGAESRDGASVPDRLLAVADEVRLTYGAFTAGPSDELDAATERGEEFFDVTYTVPDHVGTFLARLTEVLEDAEEFCRAGRYLLTLAPDPELLAYRRWLFGEFEGQIAGRPPLPWPGAGEAVGRVVDERSGEAAGGSQSPGGR